MAYIKVNPCLIWVTFSFHSMTHSKFHTERKDYTNREGGRDMFLIPLFIGAAVSIFIANNLGVPAPFTWLIGGFVATILGGFFTATSDGE